MVEKFRYFERQYLLNKTISDFAWTTLDFGSMACRASAHYDESFSDVPGWREIMPYRESVYLKNQGIANDNSTDCQIEVYFNAYVINKFKSVGTTQALVATTPYGLSYNPTTALFTVNTNGLFNPTTGIYPNHMYLEMPPFGPQDTNISDHSYLTAVCTNVTWVAGNRYTFDIGNFELLVGGAAIGTWAVPALSTWTYAAATGWSHATGNAVALSSNTFAPTVGRTYEVHVTNTTTTAGTGLTITCGTQIIKGNPSMKTGTDVYRFTATQANPLVFTPGAGGTWVGDLTAISVVDYDNNRIHDMLANNLLLPYENNRSFHPPTFYQYSTNTPGANDRGIILNTGESYSGDLTYDVCIWWRGLASADIGASLVIQQLA